ncbi:dTMP kinase [Patescibacteria group bacterium]
MKKNERKFPTSKIKKGKFIVLEGGEGSGKGVCQKYLKEKLADKNNIIWTREPGATQFGLKLREALLHGVEKRSVRAELLTFCADRANHCDLSIRPDLEEGKIVICDRFDPSTIAYQIYGHEHQDFAKTFKKINSIAKGSGSKWEIKPDLVIYLDIDPKIGLARAKARPDENTIFDNAELGFHQRVRRGYLDQYNTYKHHNWIKINASLSEEKVKEKVWQAVKKLLKI